MSGVLDAERLDALRAVGTPPGDLLRDLVVDFLREGPPSLRSAELAARDGDLAALGFHAHRLRGMSAHVAALRLSAAAGDVERAAEAGGEEVTVTLGRLRAEHAAAVAALRAVLDEGTAAS